VAYNRDHKLGFRLWEISNEPYSGAWGGDAYFKTSADYGEHLIACARAIRAADPAAQVGLEIASTIPGWGETVMRQCTGSYDFACPHYYAGTKGFGPATYYESAVLTCWQTFDWTRRDLQSLRDANTGKAIPLQVTEWAGVGDTATGQGTDLNPFGTNIVGALHRAIRQVWYLRENLVEGAMQWQSHAPSASTAGFAFFFWQKDLDARTPVWYLSDLLNNRLGDEVLADHVGSPLVEIGFDRLPVFHSVCTRDRKTGRLCWVLVNAARDDALKCRLSIRGSRLTARGRVTTLTQPLDASPIITDPTAIESDAAVSFTAGTAQVNLPAHSVSIVEVQGR
jgi:alpha-L-arabinofuranosidase